MIHTNMIYLIMVGSLTSNLQAQILFFQFDVAIF